MVKKPSSTHRPSAGRSGGVLDVTVVLLDAGYASTAIGPIEVFHSATSHQATCRKRRTVKRFKPIRPRPRDAVVGQLLCIAQNSLKTSI